MSRHVFTVCVLAALLAVAHATDARPNAEAEGRELVQKMLDQSPAENSTITGVLEIRKSRKDITKIPMQCRIVVTETNWQTIYETLANTNSVHEQFIVTRNGSGPGRYELNGTTLPNELSGVPFAGSDFWLADLGLEFIRWPTQRVLKKEIRRSRFCIVLESVFDTNNAAASQGYSRVVSWVDNETSGILHADAYDAKGKRLKEFEPKEFKKIGGQWQLQEMRMENLQTRSRSTLEFDLIIGGDAKP